MVAQDQVTAWDLKPNRENTNQIFNVLCNVQPVEHPWSGDGHLRQIDVVNGSKQQFRFEKCKGLKKCKLYKYVRASKEGERFVKLQEENTSTSYRMDNNTWRNADFTDVITFQGYRLYMRRSREIADPYGPSYGISSYGYKDDFKYQVDLDGDYTKYRPYRIGGGDDDKDTVDYSSYHIRDGQGTIYVPATRNATNRPIDRSASNKTRVEETQESQVKNTYGAGPLIRIYIQQIDPVACSGDTFDEADSSPIILAKEYEASECNPDHFIMGYGGIGLPKDIKAKQDLPIQIAIIYTGGQHFAYIYNLSEDIKELQYVYIPALGIYVSGLTPANASMEQEIIIRDSGLPLDGYFIPNISELSQVVKYPEVVEESQMAIAITNVGNIVWAYDDYGEVPYFAADNKIYSINGFYSRIDSNVNIPTDEELPDVIYRGDVDVRTPEVAMDVEDHYPRRIFLFDNEIVTATNKHTITGFERWGARLCYIAADNHLYVSGAGMLNGIFTSTAGDTARGVFNIPAGITDVKAMYGSLLLFGPKSIYAVSNQEALVAGNFINATENEDGYYNPGSYYNDDGEFLIVRRGKLLETLQFSAYYGTIQFTPDTGFFVNGHIKSLNNTIDRVNIDASTDFRYLSIYDDNDMYNHYSKLLIYNKHYNCWYYWMIDGARVVHVKDNIFLGDGIYVNKGSTWGWTDDEKNGGEIIEIISAYVGEEGLQTPKHIQYIKTAIGDHSEISDNSKWEINLSLGGKLFERRNDITTTRYPQLLMSKKSRDTILAYKNGEKIYGHGEMYPHTLGREIAGYRSYDKYSTKNIREMGENSDLTSKLAMFASIKEPVNAPANIVQLCISARGVDNVQFGSFYIGYYVLDPDYEDIENTNIDGSGLTDEAIEYGPVVNKGEYCDEILSGSACDSSEMNDQL